MKWESLDADERRNFVWYGVALDPNLPIRYQSLKKEDRDALYDAVNRHPEVAHVDETKLREILAQTAHDRLDFADRLVAFAKGVLDAKPGDEDTANRQALMAAYDALHHALRAQHIAFQGWDPIGHQETIDASNGLFGDNSDLARRYDWLNAGKSLPDAVGDIRTQRQAAEWDVYNVNEDGKPRVDFATEAPKAVRLAGETVRTVRAALYDRLAGEV